MPGVNVISRTHAELKDKLHHEARAFHSDLCASGETSAALCFEALARGLSISGADNRLIMLARALASVAVVTEAVDAQGAKCEVITPLFSASKIYHEERVVVLQINPLSIPQ